MPLISVILPVYNVEKYLRRCLSSLAGQTFTDFEIIAVNDGSTDNSPQILQEFAASDSRLQIINQSNGGLSAARNRGLKEAKGSYVYFLDSDDAIHPQLFETALFYIVKYNADMVCFEYAKSDGIEYNPQKVNIEDIKMTVSEKPLFNSCRKSGYKISFNVWSKFFKKELIAGIEFINGIHFEDYPYTYAVLARHPKTVILKEALYFYTCNPQSISNLKASPKQISDFAVGVKYVCNLYKDAPAGEYKHVTRVFLPRILKQQLQRCSHAAGETQVLMYQKFASELAELKHGGFLHWRGHKLWRYLKYLDLIRTVK